MKVGEYIRTKQGYIAKLININREFGLLEFDKPIYKENYKPSNIISFVKFNKRYLKSSEEIAELIQVGDYVNGHEITEIWEDAEHYRFAGCNYHFQITDKDIISIVTKEQYESVECLL